MAIADDWTINYTAKTVTHTAGATVYTMLAYFQWLAAEFAATAQMDDDYGIQSDTPTVYKWINGWAFGTPATDYKYLKGGSIESSDANEAWSNLYSIGSQEGGTQLYLVQNEAEITPWWGAGNIDILVLVKTGGAWIQSDDTTGTPTNGGVWVYARETDYEYDHNFVNLSGLGRNPVGINNANDLGYDGTGDIYLDVASSTGFDAGNYVEGLTSGATARINYVDGSNHYLYLTMVEGGPFSISETIQESLTRGGASTGTTTTNHATTAELDAVRGYSDVKFLHVQRNFTGGTTAGGPFQLGETITQTGTGATGKFIHEATSTLYIEETAGAFNGTGLLTGGVSGATYTPTGTAAAASITKDLNNGNGAQPYNVVVNCATRAVTPVYQYGKYITRHNAGTTINSDAGEEYRSASEGTYVDVKKAPYGTLAGGTIFGARGVWLENYAAADFSLTDANGVVQDPPNYQKVIATHASLIGCNVFVAEISAGSIVKNQYTILSVTATTIQATASININKVPQSGSLRVGDTKFAYTGFSGDTFTGVTPNPTGQTGDFYVPLLDVTADTTTEQSDNIIYSAPFDVRTTVRKYGFKPYDVDTSFGATGLPFSPILPPDPQAT